MALRLPKLRTKYADRSRAFDIMMVVLLLGSVVVAFWYETLHPVDKAPTRTVIAWIDLALVVFFVAEWTWRVRKSAPHSGRYALRNSWELLGMIPILLPLPPVLRTLRLVRLVRILRVFSVIGKRIGVWERIAKQSQLGPLALASGSVTFFGSFIVWLLEKDEAGTNLATFGGSLWWGIVTVTTVGYGDITPITTAGRFVAALLMVTGIGTIGLLASSLASALMRPDPPSQNEPLPLPRPTESIVIRAALGGELERLAGLHRSGALSDAEFGRAKAIVLGTQDAPRPPPDPGPGTSGGPTEAS